MATTSAGHISGGSGSGTAQLQFRKETQSAVDGNTVDMDIERGQFSENAVQYEAGLTFITHQIKLLNAALQS